MESRKDADDIQAVNTVVAALHVACSRRLCCVSMLYVLSYATMSEVDAAGESSSVKVRRTLARVELDVAAARVALAEASKRKRMAQANRPSRKLHWRNNKPKTSQFANSYVEPQLREFEAKFFKAAARVPVHWRLVHRQTAVASVHEGGTVQTPIVAEIVSNYEPCILLGREVRKKDNGLALSFLGGKREEADMDLVTATAYREFWEESGSLLATGGRLPPDFQLAYESGHCVTCWHAPAQYALIFDLVTSSQHADVVALPQTHQHRYGHPECVRATPRCLTAVKKSYDSD
eukprot:INCI5106.7.p1 GENE.INCI5106.7~~INCI5106.7.p1  ORF type:complete len:291 (-),score=51.35 INCI5106.7:128-1000(-)